MSLPYPETNNGFTYGINEDSRNQYIKQQLDLRIERFKQKQHLIDELTYEKQLIESDILDVIKTDIHNSSYNILYGMYDKIYLSIWQYFWHKDDKEWFKTHEENEAELKSVYEYALDRIKDAFFPQYDFELVEIIDFGYSTSYEFHYKYKDQMIEIVIPCFSHANKDNYEYLLGGYRVLYQQSTHVWSTIAFDLDYHKVAQQLQQWIEKQ